MVLSLAASSTSSEGSSRSQTSGANIRMNWTGWPCWRRASSRLLRIDLVEVGTMRWMYFDVVAVHYITFHLFPSTFHFMRVASEVVSSTLKVTPCVLKDIWCARRDSFRIEICKLTSFPSHVELFNHWRYPLLQVHNWHCIFLPSVMLPY